MSVIIEGICARAWCSFIALLIQSETEGLLDLPCPVAQMMYSTTGSLYWINRYLADRPAAFHFSMDSKAWSVDFYFQTNCCSLENAKSLAKTTDSWRNSDQSASLYESVVCLFSPALRFIWNWAEGQLVRVILENKKPLQTRYNDGWKFSSRTINFITYLSVPSERQVFGVI